MRLFPSLRSICIFFLIIILGYWVILNKLDSWLQQAAAHYVHHKTGFTLEIEELRTNLSKGVIHVKNLTLTNTPEFEDPRFLRINEIKICVDFFSLFSSKVVLHELVVDIEELCAVSNQKGTLNLSDFAKAFRSAESTREPASELPASVDPHKSAFLIERFFFRLNQITIADYRDTPPITKSARLGISRVFNNVTSVQQVILPIAGDLSIFVSDFILDEFLRSTINTKFSKKLLKVILSPVKDTLEKAKKDSEKLFEMFAPKPQKPANAS